MSQRQPVYQAPYRGEEMKSSSRYRCQGRRNPNDEKNDNKVGFIFDAFFFFQWVFLLPEWYGCGAHSGDRTW
ncbi:hypothetical protein KC321_g20 [Hortaea werneckii]|nr:hypothetical protein KC321_g20 [Hortaea werneckii]